MSLRRKSLTPFSFYNYEYTHVKVSNMTGYCKPLTPAMYFECKKEHLHETLQILYLKSDIEATLIVSLLRNISLIYCLIH